MLVAYAVSVPLRLLECVYLFPLQLACEHLFALQISSAPFSCSFPCILTLCMSAHSPCSYFVRAGSMLDGEAKDRCTSVYLVDRCVVSCVFV